VTKHTVNSKRMFDFDYFHGTWGNNPVLAIFVRYEGD
jgi:hypothetical protein